MSEFQRRDFLAGAIGLAAGTAAVLTAQSKAEGGDPSFMNNVPDDLLSGKELPTFKFELEKSEGKVIGGSYGKEATVSQLPISKGIAGVSMKIEPGAMRELHWHATAAEWAFVLEGNVRTTVISPEGYAETNDFQPGDVWYFPRGHGHMLECLGDKPCHFILIFDNGYFSEFGTFSITDWIGHTPKDLETCYLLLYGELPTAAQKENFDDRVVHHTMVHEQMTRFFQGFRRDAHPMAVMVGCVGALSAFYITTTPTSPIRPSA